MTFLAAALCFAPAATAEPVPPDNSGADQYVEGVPGAGGDKPSNGGGGSGGGTSGGSGGDAGTGGGALPEDTLATLADSGRDGELAAATLNANTPDSEALRSAARNAARGEGQGGKPNSFGSTGSGSIDELDEGSGLPGALQTAATGSESGMGLALPIILGIVAAGTIALVVRRRPWDSDSTSR